MQLEVSKAEKPHRKHRKQIKKSQPANIPKNKPTPRPNWEH